MQNLTKKKRGAIICACVAIGFLGFLLACILFPLLAERMADAFAYAFVILYSLIILAVIVGVARALSQRLRELETGEEEDAKQY